MLLKDLSIIVPRLKLLLKFYQKALFNRKLIIKIKKIGNISLLFSIDLYELS